MVIPEFAEFYRPSGPLLPEELAQGDKHGEKAETKTAAPSLPARPVAAVAGRPKEEEPKEPAKTTLDEGLEVEHGMVTTVLPLGR